VIVVSYTITVDVTLDDACKRQISEKVRSREAPPASDDRSLRDTRSRFASLA